MPQKAQSERIDVIPIIVNIPVFISKQPSPPGPIMSAAMAPIPSTDTQHGKRENLERLFREQAELWKKDTRHWSSVAKMLAHPSYLRIVGLVRLSTGNELERLLLQELESEPDHWFDALVAITGEDPVRPECDFDGAVDAWLDWGRQKGIIGH